MIHPSSQSRLVRKLEEALGKELCLALVDPTVVELMVNPDGRVLSSTFVMESYLSARCQRPPLKPLSEALRTL